MDKRVAGFDVSKGWLDASLAGKAGVERLSNTPEAVGTWLEHRRPDLVAFEPTGGYERVLCQALKARGLVALRVHPNEVIAFRHSRGIKAKTDRIDARLIADFAAQVASQRSRISIASDEGLRELSARRNQLVAHLQAEKCRLAQAQDAFVRTSVQAAIARGKTDLETIDAELAGRIKANQATAARAKLLRSLRGIGPVVTAVLIAELPELGHLTGKQISALIGLAPQTRKSGTALYREATGHGRPNVRRVLFCAARAAIRHPSPLRDFYRRLTLTNGRPGKVALTALMRKMLVILNAILRSGTPWRATATSHHGA